MRVRNCEGMTGTSSGWACRLINHANRLPPLNQLIGDRSTSNACPNHHNGMVLGFNHKAFVKRPNLGA